MEVCLAQGVLVVLALLIATLAPFVRTIEIVLLRASGVLLRAKVGARKIQPTKLEINPTVAEDENAETADNKSPAADGDDDDDGNIKKLDEDQPRKKLPNFVRDLMRQRAGVAAITQRQQAVQPPSHSVALRR